MDPSRCPRGYSSREIRDHVAARDLPGAAFAAKMALDRNAHVQLATGVLLGIGSAGIDTRRAARIAVCFQELTTCPADRRRESAAHLLMSAMRAVVPNAPSRRSVGSALVNSSGVDVTMAQPDPDRAAAYAEAMCRTMTTTDVADRMAQACGRVTNLHGCTRDATALTAYSRCALFSKQGAPAQTVIAAKQFLLACVRAAYEISPITDVSSPELIDALAATEKIAVVTPAAKAAAKAARAQAPAPDDPFQQAGMVHNTDDDDDDRIPTGTKMAALWTFVHKEPGRGESVVHAADLQVSTEVRIIDGKGLLSEPSASTLGRVHLVP